MVGLCTPEIWNHAGLIRVIILVPLDLKQGGQIKAVLQLQMASIKTQLEQIAAGAEATPEQKAAASEARAKANAALQAAGVTLEPAK